jgi:Uma2 family endonuclease
MTTQTAALPIQGTMAGFRRFSVAEYHRMIAAGILTEDDNLELLEGYLVHKMTRSPRHDGTLQLLYAALSRHLSSDWCIRIQCAITLGDSEPEPDGAVVRGDERSYLARHPAPYDIGVVIEVADSTLSADRIDKGRIYARAGIVCYWIVNLSERQIEVYTAPSGPTAAPAYGQRKDYRPGDQLPLGLNGAPLVHLAVDDLLP